MSKSKRNRPVALDLLLRQVNVKVTPADTLRWTAEIRKIARRYVLARLAWATDHLGKRPPMPPFLRDYPVIRGKARTLTPPMTAQLGPIPDEY